MRKYTYFFVTILLFLLAPLHFGERVMVRNLPSLFSVQTAEAYTYQDVDNWLAANPAPEGCTYRIERVDIDSGTYGYRIWERCDDAIYAIQRVLRGGQYIGDIADHAKGYYDACDGSGSQIYLDVGSPFYYFSYSSVYDIEMYCSEKKVEKLIPSNTYYWKDPCYFKSNIYFDCHNLDRLAAEFIPIDECEVSVTVSLSEVLPQGAGSSETTSTISVSLTKSAPPEGCTINFTVEAVENSGGHSSHTGSKPKGIVSPSSVYFASNEGWGPKTAEYNSSEVSGEEKIKIKVNDKDSGEMVVTVKVPGLGALAEGDYWKLTGSSGTTTVEKCSGKQITHSGNHYMTLATGYLIARIAQNYYKETNTILGINDASLIWGGLFDVCGDWGKPHTSHRGGKSVDIDRKIQDTETLGYMDVDRKLLDKITGYYGGVKVKEPTIHYEF